MKITLLMTLLLSLTLLNPFENSAQTDKEPRPVTRTRTIIKGQQVIITDILFDETTSREEVIETCKFLEDEGVMLTFNELNIGKCGKKQRIKYADGKISFPGKFSQNFKAPNCFKSLKIEYAVDRATKNPTINRIEVIK